MYVLCMQLYIYLELPIKKGGVLLSRKDFPFSPQNNRTLSFSQKYPCPGLRFLVTPFSVDNSGSVTACILNAVMACPHLDCTCYRKGRQIRPASSPQNKFLEQFSQEEGPRILFPSKIVDRTATPSSPISAVSISLKLPLCNMFVIFAFTISSTRSRMSRSLLGVEL